VILTGEERTAPGQLVVLGPRPELVATVGKEYVNNIIENCPTTAGKWYGTYVLPCQQSETVVPNSVFR
jgi:hypothetical protein